MCKGLVSEPDREPSKMKLTVNAFNTLLVMCLICLLFVGVSARRKRGNIIIIGGSSGGGSVEEEKQYIPIPVPYSQFM